MNELRTAERTAPARQLSLLRERSTREMPDLRSYDVLLVNSSAGKDSQATLDTVVRLADELGIRDRVIVVHADLGRVEWKGTKELAEEHARHYGVRFEVIKRPQGDLLEHIEARGMFPDSQNRYCTSDHKRGQVSKVITMLVRELDLPRQARVLNIMGIRAAESAARSKKKPFENDRRNTNGKRHVDTWFPIFDLTTAEVWAVNRRAGTRHHYAYDLGMPRLSCAFCIFAPKPALVTAGKHNRELLAEYVRVEKESGHTFRQDISLVEVLEAVDNGEEPGEVKTWEM